MRRMDAQSRRTYRMQQRSTAFKRAKLRRGVIKQQQNTDKFRTERKPGTGGFSDGLGIQQQRMREKGQEIQRAEDMRPPLRGEDQDLRFPK